MSETPEETISRLENIIVSEIPDLIHSIGDSGKRLVADSGCEIGSIEDLRRQFRELAHRLMLGREVKLSDLL